MKVSETFASIQGEGQWVGYPAVFLRLQGCNLLCGNPNLKDVTNKKEQEEIIRRQNQKATWICDTIAVWLHGKDYSAKELYAEWEKKGFINNIIKGSHVVVTGGEPLLQQDNLELINFLTLLKERYKAYIEVETNGTVLPTEQFNSLVSFYNCSPKLSNSVMPRNKRINSTAIRFITKQEHCFKFVVSSEEDINEIITDFINPFINTSNGRVYIMPGCNNREEYIKISTLLVPLCSKYNLQLSPRLHIIIWNQRTGV